MNLAHALSLKTLIEFQHPNNLVKKEDSFEFEHNVDLSKVCQFEYSYEHLIHG